MEVFNINLKALTQFSFLFLRKKNRGFFPPTPCKLNYTSYCFHLERHQLKQPSDDSLLASVIRK